MASKTVRSVCPYCGVGCGIVMQVENNRVVKVSGDKAHPTNAGRLCTKGTTCGQAIAESGRMEHAYLRQERQRDPVRIAMDKAISETASRLRDTLARSLTIMQVAPSSVNRSSNANPSSVKKATVRARSRSRTSP